MSAGRITVLAYLVVFLLVPMVGISIIGRPDYSIYHFSGIQFIGAATIFVLIAACFTPLFSLGSRPRGSGKFLNAAYGAFRRWVAILSLALLVLFVVFYPADKASYRYFNQGISGLGAGFFLAIALKTICASLLIWLMAEYIREPETSPWTHRLAVLLLTATLVYGSSGTGDVFTASFFVLLFISPRWFVRFVTIDRQSHLLARKNLYKLLGVVVIAVQAFVSLNIGENIKEGTGTVGQSIMASIQQAAGTFHDMTAEPTIAATKEIEAARPKAIISVASTGSWFVVRILEGIASHYYSTMQFFDGWAQERLRGYAYPLTYTFDTVAYRLDVLLHRGAPERPYVQSISRLNFLVLSMHPNATEGTSPGAVAAFSYLFPLPLGLLAALLYLALIAVMTNRMFYSPERKISAVGGLVIMIQLQMLFQTPPDFLLLIDNGAVFFVSFALLSIITSPHSDAAKIVTPAQVD